MKINSRKGEGAPEHVKRAFYAIPLFPHTFMRPQLKASKWAQEFQGKIKHV